MKNKYINNSNLTWEIKVQSVEVIHTEIAYFSFFSFFSFYSDMNIFRFCDTTRKWHSRFSYTLCLKVVIFFNVVAADHITRKKETAA